MTVHEALLEAAKKVITRPDLPRLTAAEAIIELADLWVAANQGARLMMSMRTVAIQERDAARENHLKAMTERDTAFGLLDEFRKLAEHDIVPSEHLIRAAKKLTTP